ncbi:hypothetical protein F5B22DRAFT_641774 [Xylaria bambusicola]|uniref:uncharacterized protein n=1 Tax=Xylaria bambusicola TaxID=326684 RepID=UPI00200863EB|nr:uncharacterized protein F5B22DRAFT_641774 [Xylaria bambusicola]KAI0526632.1 hypothetical protein F5B22DRAFT_641774 [Xylaria bambusicola]
MTANLPAFIPDSIDLQDHDAPSAQDHKHPNSKSTLHANTNGSLAPHQAGTIREVIEERVEEEARSPRVSWANGDGGHDRDLQLYAEELASGIVNSLNGNKMQQQDALAIAQNGGVGGHADDDGDIEVNTDDDDLDDDMMDKISSSPSIEDGGYTLPPAWPARIDSLRNSLSIHDCSSSPVVTEARSSSPYLELPDHFPLQLSEEQLSKASVDIRDPNLLLPGGYAGANEHEIHNDAPDYKVLSGAEALAHGSDDMVAIVQDSERLHEQNYLTQDRDSGVDLKIEDFSLSRQIGADDELVEDEIISPYEFLIPYVASDDDDDEEEEEDFPFTDDCRFIDSGWGGECLQDTEDIDFEFVYALHTFVATVEGQANATKGDTMVLLDDSNSYWWLVRVVKDSSIGYLPAEHIETPTERLARLNKHRNIDLSATMLGDQSDKARNPIMTAMKRRKTKTVSFAPPTVVNYPDIDYSDEEDEEDDGQDPQQVSQQEDQQQQVSSQSATADLIEDDQSAKVEPLKPRNQKQAKVDPSRPEEASKGEPQLKELGSRNSDEIFDGKTERTTKNGTVRNTDSFFKDETIETKKITLTPGLLRDDNESRVSSDSKELRQRPSLEKDLVPDKNKDEKKKKEKEKKDNKKPSAIRSFFSRKDKKKSLDDDDESFGKRSMDAGAGFGDTDMVEEPEEMESSPHKSPQRNSSKLQKQQPRTEQSPTRKSGIVPTVAADSNRGPPLAAEVKTNNVSNVPPATVRMVESEQPENQVLQGRKDENSNSGLSKITPANAESNPPKVTKAKSRIELDDFDSSEEEAVPEPTRAPPAEPIREPSDDKLMRPSLPGSFPDSSTSILQQNEAAGVRSPADELSESPIQVSPITSSNPPALMGDTSSQEDRSSPVSSPSPELADAHGNAYKPQESAAPSTSVAASSTWNDANLRAFFDSGSEIRDLLVVVYDDKNDAPSVGPNHPIASSLFREQNAKLAEITTQLDNMLGDWLARKQRLRGTV